ncbi:MAG: zinc ribbon domain-containing protein [Chloroflexi bacterium]|nr:zinc ribbon domain-containing protein [Chloroflexota bacterium]
MNEETVDCFNCGRTNPEWAQVCRSCGVSLRHGEARVVPAGRYPTDRDSLMSMGAVIGTIVVAVVIGLFVSSLNPIDPTIGADPSPTVAPTPTPTEEPSVEPSASESVAPTPEPTPELPGTVAFGTELDGNKQVVNPVETFTPGMVFAHSISSTEPFGAATIGEQVVRLNEDGTEGEEIVAAAGNQLGVDPAGTTAGFVAGDAANFVRDWGPGVYEMRVYVGETVIARGQFRLAEG